MSVILATAGQDDKIRFWEAPSGICSRVLRYADSQVNCLEITTDKQYLAAGGNPHIRLFEINNSSNQNPILCLEGHTGNVTSLGFQRNGRYLYSGSEDGTVKLWDLRSPTYSRSFDSKGAVNSVALHPNQAEIISGKYVLATPPVEICLLYRRSVFADTEHFMRSPLRKATRMDPSRYST